MTKRRGIKCSEVCWIWDRYDKDCDIMGEHHLHPRICPIFKKHDEDLWEKLFGEKKDDNS